MLCLFRRTGATACAGGRAVADDVATGDQTEINGTTVSESGVADDVAVAGTGIKTISPLSLGIEHRWKRYGGAK